MPTSEIGWIIVSTEALSRARGIRRRVESGQQETPQIVVLVRPIARSKTASSRQFMSQCIADLQHHPSIVLAPTSIVKATRSIKDIDVAGPAGKDDLLLFPDMGRHLSIADPRVLTAHISMAIVRLALNRRRYIRRQDCKGPVVGLYIKNIYECADISHFRFIEVIIVATAQSIHRGATAKD